MGCNWRIRHKLMLGMALVIAIMGLLLAGTLKGLASYRATMRTMGSKLAELNEADNFRAAVKDINDKFATDIWDKVRLAKEALQRYQVKLLDSVSGGRDPDDCFREKSQIDALNLGFTKLETTLKQKLSPDILRPGDDPDKRNIPTHEALNSLLSSANDLVNVISTKVQDRIAVSKTDYKVSFAIVMTTNVIAVFLMAGLLRFFYRSMAHPMQARLHV